MSAPVTRRTTHRTDVAAPADRVYALVRDASDWPRRFSPTVHVAREELEASSERLRIWATANGEVKHWTSHRTLDPAGRRVRFRQEVCSPPVAAMSGEWVVEERAPDACALTLHHTFASVDDRPESLDWISSATDRNSRTELADLKALAEDGGSDAELLFSFEDTETASAPAEAVYDFLAEAGAWPERLPHVSRLHLSQPGGGIQVMTMVTRAAGGSEHTTESVRVCFPDELRIVYKQTVTPPVMTLHTGEWRVEPAPEGVRVTSRHTIRLNEPAIRDVLGADATRASARAHVRTAVGGNSAATLALAKRFAEAAHAG